jgi:ornithine cyclodeaminase
MNDDALLLLTADDVAALTREQESAIVETVRQAYEMHGRGESLLPHSTFMRFPGGRNRMIALPAALGGNLGIAGLKWIASFPGNLALGRARASGVIVLSSVATGQPLAIVEGSLVSAMRTAASAALAAHALHGSPPASVGLVGCGVINLETLRFLRHLWPGIEHVVLHDLSAERAMHFAHRCADLFRVRVEIVGHWRLLAERVSLASIATTAMQPYLHEIPQGPLRTVLHLSLRDLAPALILGGDNIVDDADHVCRAETSLHLAEQLVGNRRFIRGALADVLARVVPPKGDYDRPTIFSPFGLGILDIAVAHHLCERAIAAGRGVRLPFAPTTAD